MVKIIKPEQYRIQQLSILGYIVHNAKTYFIKERYSKKIDPETIKTLPGDIIVMNGNFYTVLTPDRSKAKQVNLSSKHRT